MEKITKIQLQIGILSGIEPILMHNAFEAVVAVENPAFKNCQLEIEVIPVSVHCKECDSRSEILNYKFVCDYCGQPCNNIICGDELNIVGFEVDD